MKLGSLVLGGGLLILTGAGAFVAGRKYPFSFLEPKPVAKAYFEWRQGKPSPIPRYEAATALIGDKLYVFGGFFTDSIDATTRVDVYDPAADTWTRKKDMPAAITHADAVLVGDTVWMAGGIIGKSPGTPTSSVWRYAPVTDTWTAGPPLPKPRLGGVLARLGNALHYVGGFQEDLDTGSQDHWVLDLAAAPGTAHWAPSTPMPMARGHMSGGTVGGMLYVIGGSIQHDPYPFDVDVVHKYDPGTDRWSEVASLPWPLSHTEPGTFEHEGKIVVVAGRSRSTRHNAVRDIREYDPALNHWRALPPLPLSRFAPFARFLGDDLIVGTGGTGYHTPQAGPLWIGNWKNQWQLGDSMPLPLGEVAGGVIGDHLYLVGQGDEATLSYDLRDGHWDPADTHPVRMSPGHHETAEVVGGRLYVLGGLPPVSDSVVQIFDPAVDRWLLGPALPFQSGSAASSVIDGMIYYAGGITRSHRTTAEMARLDPATGKWTALAPMPHPRNHAAAATDGHRLYIFGGRGPGSGDSNVVANGFGDVQIYDPATNTWTVSGTTPGAPAPLPQARGGMGRAVYYHGEFYIMGGETLTGAGATASHVYTRVDIYDPTANTWRLGPPLPTGRHGIFPILDNDAIVVAGGGERAGGALSSLVEIFRLR